MEFYTCGVIRVQSPRIAAAACASRNQEGEYFETQTQSLPPDPKITNQRAELLGVVIGLRQALERTTALAENPSLMFNIYTNSRHAVMCMALWRHKWESRGWKTFTGKQAPDRDLLEEATFLHNTLKEWGEVNYILITKTENEYAYRLCHEDVDRQIHGAQVSEPVHHESESEVSDTIHQQSEPEVSDAVHKQTESEVSDTVHKQTESENLEPVRKQLEPEVLELVQQLSESKVSEPVQQ